MKQKYERMAGLSDAMPAEAARRRVIQSSLEATFGRFGYLPVEVPLLEQTDLFLCKVGEQLAAHMYSFDYKNKRVCLRPEFTSAIGRLYVERLTEAPHPVRLQYAGPVFRTNGLPADRAAGVENRRQFTQAGIELLGAVGPAADAEVIAAACHGLDDLGLQNYHVVLGHMGTVNEYLQHLNLDPRAVNLLLSKMEELNPSGRGVAHIEEVVRELYPDLITKDPLDLPDTSPRLYVTEIPLPSQLNEDDTRAVISSFLDGIRIDFSDAQQQDEIVERLLIKLRRRSQNDGLRRALTFIAELNSLQGPADFVFPALGDLLDRYNLNQEPLDELAEVTELLVFHGIPANRIYINLALSRGFQYYTGMIFDLYRDVEEGHERLGGGGRYDDLIGLIGGAEDVPACGFSYTLELIMHALEAENSPIAQQVAPLPDVYLAPLHGMEISYIVSLAERLRRAGLCAVMSTHPLPDRNAALENALATGSRLLVTVSDRGRDADKIVLSTLTESQAHGGKDVEFEKFVAEVKVALGEETVDDQW